MITRLLLSKLLNLNNGFLAINFSSNYRTPDYRITEANLEEFLTEIKSYLLEIFNINISIEEKETSY